MADNTTTFFYAGHEQPDSHACYDNFDEAVKFAAKRSTDNGSPYTVFKAVASVEGATPPHTVTTLTDPAPVASPASA